MRIQAVRSVREAADAAWLMRGLVEANKVLYSDDLETIGRYYSGAWFLADPPEVPPRFRPPNGEVLVAYVADAPVGTVAICRMDAAHCALKSIFVAPENRNAGMAAALSCAAIELAGSQGYQFIRLTTGSRQLPARRLYERLGFSIVAPWDENPPDGYDHFERALPHTLPRA
jgi:putative acetyltransferase